MRYDSSENAGILKRTFFLEIKVECSCIDCDFMACLLCQFKDDVFLSEKILNCGHLYKVPSLDIFHLNIGPYNGYLRIISRCYYLSSRVTAHFMNDALFRFFTTTFWRSQATFYSIYRKR